MKDKYQAAQALLGQIETRLKTLHLWQSGYPSAQALASQAPFCCDTLDFGQWLQFILIPRMQALIDGQQPLPDKIAIAPMAEESFKHLGKAAVELIATLGEFDKLLSGDAKGNVSGDDNG